MMVIDEDYKFGITWEVIEISSDQSFVYGHMHFIIDDEIMPKKCSFNHTLNVVFGGLKRSFTQPYYSDNSTATELGSIAVDNHELSYGRVPNILDLNTSDIGMSYVGWENYGSIALKLGFDRNFERLFYSEDNGKNFREIRLKRGTVEKVIFALPTTEQLIMNKSV